MTRLKSALASLFAVTALALPGIAQDAVPDAAKNAVKERKQPQPAGFQAEINDTFGTAIGYLTHYPFMNIAGWFGLDTDPQLLRDEQDEPQATATILKGHTGAVTLAVWSPDGGTVLTLGADNTARLFDLDGAELASLPHPAAPLSAAFYPGGGEFTTTCADGKLRVFSAAEVDGATKWTQQMEIAGHPGGASRVGYSSDGTWLWSFGADGAVRLWLATGEQQFELLGVTSIRQVLISSDDDLEKQEELLFVLDGTGDLTVHKANGTELGKVESLNIERLEILPDGSFALATLGPDKFRVLDPKGETVGNFLLQADTSSTAASIASVEGEVRITITDDKGMVRVYGAGGNELSVEKTEPSGYFLEADARSPNSVALRNRASTETAWVLQGHDGKVLGHGLSPDETRAVTFSEDGTARVWEWFIHGPDGKPVSTTIPFVVLWLVIAAVLFTFYMRFVNIRMFGHALQVVRGKFSNPEDAGEVSHFQALASALSATVGLGNIAGVAIAVSVGGPGATFWMIVAGLLGMTLKFTECTLGQKFRKIDENGTVSGGPMHYLKDGLKQKGLGILGVPLALIFTVFCIGGSLAGGNAFQVNQSGNILQGQVQFFADYPWVYGVGLAFMVGVVIIGGIKRIAHTAEAIVPTMCGIYVLAAMTILVMNIEAVPGAFGQIFAGALSGDAIYGGALGSLIMGFRRAAFSNEAGVGSASIAHSAARTPYAVREGIVALLEPFIDTVVVCTMTALVIVITGVYNNPEYAEMISGNNGAGLTAMAFGKSDVLAGWFPWVLMSAVILFAFSTMISWSYYGERCWTNLFGPKSSLSFKILFLLFTVLGSIVTATNVLEFGDVMILLMAFPNILGLYFLGGIVKSDLKEYEEKRDAGEFEVFK